MRSTVSRLIAKLPGIGITNKPTRLGRNKKKHTSYLLLAAFLTLCVAKMTKEVAMDTTRRMARDAVAATHSIGNLGAVSMAMKGWSTFVTIQS